MSDAEATEIRRRLEDQVEGVLDRLTPGWKRRGNTAYLTPKSAKDLGSFTVSLRDGQRLPRGCWYRHSQKIGGGSVELVSYVLTGRKDDYRAAFAWAKDFLGIRDEQLSDEEREARDQRRAADTAAREEAAARAAAESERKKARNAENARDIWAESQPLKGSHGDAYQQARGIPPVADWKWDPHDTLRFHPSLGFYDEGRLAGRYPAVVCAVLDAFGELTAVWRVYLDPARAAKLDVPNPKVGLGPALGGAVRIGGDAPDIGVAEGYESALGGWFLNDCRRPYWALLSTSGMSGFEAPLFIKRVRIGLDSDFGKFDEATGRLMEPPGTLAARQLQARLLTTNIECIVEDRQVHGDMLDLWNERRKYEQEHAGSP